MSEREQVCQELDAMHELQSRYRFLHSLVDEVADPILVVGTDFHVKFANRAARNFSPDFIWQEGEEPTCYNLVYNSSCQCSTVGRPCPLTEVVETLKSVVVEHEVEVADGQMRTFEIHASPLWDEAGDFLGIVESLRDVTGRKEYANMLKKDQSELERRVQERTADLLRSNDILRKEIDGRQRIEKILRSERDKFQSMLGAMGQGMHILNSDFIIEYQNDVLRDLFGDKIGHTCFEVYKQRSEPCEACRMHAAIEGGKIQRTEEVMADGHYYAQSYAPFRDIDGFDKCLILLKDITEEKAYLAETMRTGQLASIGELAAGVAHEINNPINGIINFSQVLCDELDDDATHEVLGRIIKEGERVADIVSKLLSFARQSDVGSDALLATDVREVMADSLSLINYQYKKDGIDFSIESPEELPDVWCNPQQLQQVFVNLLSNGRYALNSRYPERNPDKKLLVKLGPVTIDGSTFVRVQITDHGCGIPDDIIDSVCNPFFSTKKPGEGTGLGLSISQGLVKEFGGYLRIQSEVDKYTIIMVDLPLHRTEEEVKDD